MLGTGPTNIKVTVEASVPNPLNAIDMYSVVNSTSTSANIITRNGTSVPLATNLSASEYLTTSVAYTMPHTNTGGDYFELLFYAGDVTVNQRQQVEGYLAHKWGLVANLPATHPYKKLRT
jgi:hypothetical protein